MVRRTKEEAQATRSRILDTAEQLFQAHGVSRTSLNDIAQAAGLTRGAIYWHFEDKADLFNAMMHRVTLPMEESVSRSNEAMTLDPLGHIRTSFTDALRKTVNDPQVRRVFEIAIHKVEYVDELLAVRDRHLSVRNDCLADVEHGLKLAMRRGQLARRVPARSAAFGLFGLVDGLIQNWMLDPSAFDLVAVGEQVLDSYLAGLAAAPSSRRTAPRLERRHPEPLPQSG